ncbi:dihydrodipicolinate reductase C-terminal domain-containing protein [Burkholderia guangdongensis]|uniref:dihydrodipicolinate reductase C-terminal domain-containing protein n=1 Tax=Burkholderia guangdongensis TaxID=1792500 RepID=UPI0015C95FA0|nr:dihydrodipicolinate reductase C-terminal domain-containing protein [Burkholderia guangdongensis]
MQVIVVGSGKLATELLDSIEPGDAFDLMPWSGKKPAGERSIVVHAGSGRELSEVVAFCRATASTLVELSTGSAIEGARPDFPVVLCPNTNILMLKFMHMLETSGHLFRGYGISVVESHQASKTSVPGTAVDIARSLGLADDEIRSVRNPDVQREQLGIPDDQLARHAFHRIRIEDGAGSIEMDTRVYGASPYADGVSRIVDAVCRHDLEPRIHSVMELVANGWV